ncbi:hypothetical protein CALCODRAFT_494741 [Calocera cornea HHB12733]|uniref:Thioesterase domain-containing protein n=1 Tax=Calocera cornea HHB12733 TaxID=1353952 RepID=A0A165GUG3_9BASI|nr:hypothetical protein CALCODRAFT_494741 [Calocera cornea HHB12733]
MADAIGGNAEPALKARVWELWRRFACELDLDEPDFGYENKKHIKFVTLNVYGEEDRSGKEKRTIETIHEVTVTKAFLNSGGNMHGGCTAFLIDVCSSATLSPFAEGDKGDKMSVSMNLNVIYHAPAPLGTPLRVISKSVTAGGRVQTVRSEIWDIKRDKLVASGVHLKMQARPRL